MNNNMGYACINMQLSKQKPRIYTGRSMIKRTFEAKGIKYASELGLDNCKDLLTIVKWNNENGFKFFRITSNLFPWSSEYKLSDMPDYEEICNILSNVGKYVKENEMRITCHPGPFNVLTSPHEHVVDNCIVDLSIHGEVFDLMGLSRTPFNKINIHIGGVYGDKISAMERFCTNFERLPESVLGVISYLLFIIQNQETSNRKMTRFVHRLILITLLITLIHMRIELTSW